jgi:hypothetical protein
VVADGLEFIFDTKTEVRFDSMTRVYFDVFVWIVFTGN